MSLQQKWIEAIYRVATGDRRKRAILGPLGAVFFFMFVGMFIVVSWVLDIRLGAPRLFPSPYNIVVSIPVLLAGILLVIWCNIYFVRAKGTPVPLAPPRSLVDGGPFQYSRNPMLTGLFAVLFGISILMSSFFLMFVFTPLFVILNALQLKYIEEPELERRLGEPYIQYKNRIPMFIPRLRQTKR